MGLNTKSGATQHAPQPPGDHTRRPSDFDVFRGVGCSHPTLVRELLNSGRTFAVNVATCTSLMTRATQHALSLRVITPEGHRIYVFRGLDVSTKRWFGNFLDFPMECRL